MLSTKFVRLEVSPITAGVTFVTWSDTHKEGYLLSDVSLDCKDNEDRNNNVKSEYLTVVDGVVFYKFTGEAWSEDDFGED